MVGRQGGSLPFEAGAGREYEKGMRDGAGSSWDAHISPVVHVAT